MEKFSDRWKSMKFLKERNDQDTSGDAALARQLVDQESKHLSEERQRQEKLDVAYARKLSSHDSEPRSLMASMVIPPGLRRKQQQNHHIRDCPGNHGLKVSEIIGTQRALCNNCQKVISNCHVYSCSICDFDVCSSCVSPEVAVTSALGDEAPLKAKQKAFNREPAHMCHIPCVIGDNGVCVEMMIDTGAQSSVMSSSLAQELNLSIDHRHRGVASGVGQAQIIGISRDVPCIFNGDMMEFSMDFLILEMKPPQRLLIMGLDQLRKYKCLVDLERSILIFGGTGGLEVPMLPPDKIPLGSRYDFRDLESCNVS